MSGKAWDIYIMDPMNELQKQPQLNVSSFSSQFESAPNGIDIPLYIYITISLANSFIFIVGSIGNICVISLIIKVRHLRTPTNMFLLNLSVADVLVLLVCQPAGLLELFGKDRWFLGEILCKLVPFMENGVLNVSILTKLAVTFERYRATCHPLKYRMAPTISVAIKQIVVIWIAGMILTFPFLIMTEYEDAMFYDGSPIKVCRTNLNEMWRYCYTIFIFIIFFALPLIALIGFHACITRQLMSNTLKYLAQNDSKAMNALKRRKQVVLMFIFTTVLFFVSLFPIRVIYLWFIFTSKAEVIKKGLEEYLNLISWARILMCINSVGNPFIYSLTSTKFKSALKKGFGRDTRFPQGSSRSYKYSYKRSNNNKLGNSVKIPLSRLTGTHLSKCLGKRLPQACEASTATHND